MLTLIKSIRARLLSSVQMKNKRKSDERMRNNTRAQ